MKIYFSAALTSDKDLRDKYNRIINYLKSKGHIVLVFGPDKIDPAILVDRSDDEIRYAYKKLDKYLKDCDLYIAEISQPSVGIGYETANTLLMKKFTLILKYEAADYEALASLEGNQSSFLRFKRYNNNNLESILDSFLNESKDKVYTKFNFILPPEIDNFLELNSRKLNKTKSDLVRDALMDFMKRNT